MPYGRVAAFKVYSVFLCLPENTALTRLLGYKYALGIAYHFRAYMLVCLRVSHYRTDMNPSLMGKGTFAHIRSVVPVSHIGKFVHKIRGLPQFLQLLICYTIQFQF